jgi:hypothetical protein
MRNALRSITLSSTMAAVLISLAATAPARAQSQPTPQMRSEATTLMLICRGDYDRLCSGVVPGGGRILACLQSYASQLSAACAQAMPRAEALRNSAAASGMLPR